MWCIYFSKEDNAQDGELHKPVIDMCVFNSFAMRAFLFSLPLGYPLVSFRDE
jgi:hypothetical protein